MFYYAAKHMLHGETHVYIYALHYNIGIFRRLFKKIYHIYTYTVKIMNFRHDCTKVNRIFLKKPDLNHTSFRWIKVITFG